MMCTRLLAMWRFIIALNTSSIHATVQFLLLISHLCDTPALTTSTRTSPGTDIELVRVANKYCQLTEGITNWVARTVTYL